MMPQSGISRGQQYGAQTLRDVEPKGVPVQKTWMMKMTKQIGALVAGLVLLGGTSLPLRAESPARPAGLSRPNIVMFVVDDLGWADIGANNPDTFYDTPNIDALAARGVRFTNGYAANPTCSPSRFALLTGRYPTRSAATNWFHRAGTAQRSGRMQSAQSQDFMAQSELTLAEALKALGYSTWFVGKWHLGEGEQYAPEAQGFDVNIAGIWNGSPTGMNGKGSYMSPYDNPRIEDGPAGEYLTRRLGSESAGLIERSSGQPFLLYHAFYSVHTPLQAPEADVAPYAAKASEQSEADDFADEEQVWPVDEQRRVRIRQNHPTYAAMVNIMDETVGRVMAALEAKGLADNTIVIFTSDNGGLSTSEGSPTSNLPLRGGKGWLYEGGIRVPYIIYVPGAKANGTASDVPAMGTDFMPTIASLLGTPSIASTAVDGVDLSPILQGEAAGPERPLFWHYPHYSNQGGIPGAAIRIGDYKLIERFEDGSVNLYDLSSDPGEKNDLARSDPQRARTMRARLHAWYEDVRARFLRPLENAD